MRFLFCTAFLFSSLLFNLPAAYADEASKGRDLFLRRCLGCHAFICNKEGPKLGGLIGRKAASVGDYHDYSQALRNSGIVWTEDTLDAFFTDPGKVTPGGTMASSGKIEDAAQRRQIIAFLKTEDPSINICPQ